jgi:hypothetical protein
VPQTTTMAPKFRTCYHYLDDPKWAVDDLEKKHVKISLFDAVNDKQELRAYMIEGYEDGADAFISWMTKTKALLCFCPDPTDAYMWNRYGGKHAGVCFGIQVQPKFLMQVTYVKEKQVGKFPLRIQQEMRASLSKGSLPDSIAKKCTRYLIPFFTTKYEGEWSRERESRILLRKDEIHGDGQYYASFKNNGLYLREVILGRDCTESEERFKELVKPFARQPIKVSREPEP